MWKHFLRACALYAYISMKLSVVMLNVIVLSVVLLNVVMLSVLVS